MLMMPMLTTTTDVTMVDLAPTCGTANIFYLSPCWQYAKRKYGTNGQSEVQVTSGPTTINHDK